MVTIDVSIEDISRLMGFDNPLTPQELDDILAFCISEVDSEPEGPDENGHTKISIDIKTSNRADLWSAEGLARTIRGMNLEPGLPPLDMEPSGYEIDVNSKLKGIRPYIAAAVIRGLELDNFLIKQMIQMQDKLDFSYGRKRKRTSIGIYNINMLESPIKYEIVDRTFKFQPLQFDKKITVDEIFEQHPKGIEYRSILENHEQVPMLYDVNNQVLSMPPIINSNDVGRVTTETTDVLIEVTGTSFDATNVVMNIVAQALRDRGGQLYSVRINYPDSYGIVNETTPHSLPLELEINPQQINDYLGTKFTKDQMIELLRKRCHDVKVSKRKMIVLSPPWRKEILHWVDISEEIAIAADYTTLPVTDANVVTTGKLDPSTEDELMVRQVLVGMNLIEVLNYTLTDRETIGSKINRSDKWVDENCIEISNPVSLTRAFFRPDLLSGLLRFSSRNTHVEYPHRIYETGEVVLQHGDDTVTKIHTSVLLSGAEETFETINRILDTLFRLLEVEYSLNELDSNYYLKGRSASIQFNGDSIGHIGEIHPSILENYGIEVPTVGLEIDLSLLPNLKAYPLYSNKN